MRAAQLFDQEETALLRYAFSYVGRHEVAEEIVQEVFLQLHTRWDEVETPRAWLFSHSAQSSVQFCPRPSA